MMTQQSRRIPFAPDGQVTLEGVPEALEKFEVDIDRLDPEYALKYGRFVLPKLTDALSAKIYHVELYRRNPSRWYSDYGHLDLKVPPSITWGVVGLTLVAGTVAAELAIQREAEGVGYETKLDFPNTKPEDIHSSIANVWCQLAVTNPELQTL